MRPVYDFDHVLRCVHYLQAEFGSANLALAVISPRSKTRGTLTIFEEYSRNSTVYEDGTGYMTITTSLMNTDTKLSRDWQYME
jgi:hypothetical protein